MFTRRTVLQFLASLCPTYWLPANATGMLLLQKPESPPDFPHLPGTSYEEKLEAAINLEWGTFGKHREYYPEYKTVLLGFCGNDHLEAILRTQHQISQIYVDAIKIILHARATGRMSNLKETVLHAITQRRLSYETPKP